MEQANGTNTKKEKKKERPGLEKKDISEDIFHISFNHS